MAEYVFHDKIMGAMMLSRAYHGCYVLLKDELANHYTISNNNYPTNMDRYMALLNNYKSVNKKYNSNLVNQEEAALFQDQDRHKYVT